MFCLVGEAPKLLSELKNLTVAVNEKISLSCSISAGDPVAQIKWYCKNKEITKSKKYELSFVDTTATLTINMTELSDATAYRCEAVNKLGKCETQCSLAILCKSKAKVNFSLNICCSKTQAVTQKNSYKSAVE